jgi:NitT/TauT family transport system substrate-binding protein
MTRTIVRLALSVLVLSAVAAPAWAAPKTKFRVAWSIYVGWMPWGYMKDAKIIDKWAAKHGIEIDVVQINDYMESINLYTAGQYDGCSMTNMDALTVPAAGGVDSTALVVGDFSNGNDGIVLKDATALAAVKGRPVHLVELSVSHYLLARALDTVGLAEKDVTVTNVSDADVVAAFATPDVQAAVTWNPQLSAIKALPKAHLVFDSSKIPGEIIDLMVVNTATLRENPALGKALVGAWWPTPARRGRPRGPRWRRRRAPISRASRASSPRPRCSTRPPMPWRSRAAPRCPTPWRRCGSSASRTGSSAPVRSRPTRSESSSPAGRRSATPAT